jgi:hypothetical protein
LRLIVAIPGTTLLTRKQPFPGRGFSEFKNFEISISYDRNEVASAIVSNDAVYFDGFCPLGCF